MCLACACVRARCDGMIRGAHVWSWCPCPPPGEHARELISVESFFDLVHNLTKGFHAPCHTAAGAPPLSASSPSLASLLFTPCYMFPHSISHAVSHTAVALGDSCGHCRALGRYSRFILSRMEFTIVGLLNPDGKLQMERTKDYCWRNNGRSHPFTLISLMTHGIYEP